MSELRKRQVQTITKTQLGAYQVTIWSSLTDSDRSLSCFMGPDAELVELVEEAKLFGMPFMDAVERLRDILEAVPRVAAYAVTDENGSGTVVELL